MAALAQVSDLQNLPLWEIVRDFVPAEDTKLANRATRSVESYCGRRLAPFTITETHRLMDIDVESQVEGYGPILDTSTILGISRARSLGATQLVSDLWLNHYPSHFVEMWSGALLGVNLFRSYGGTVPIPVTLSSIQFEPDSGHIRFPVGTFIPQGTTGQVTYSGGYGPVVPDDLVQATVYEMALLALADLSIERKGDIDVGELKERKAELLAPYTREQP